MRENCLSGLEGGARSIPCSYPYLARVMAPMRVRWLEVEASHEPKGRASSPLRADSPNHA